MKETKITDQKSSITLNNTIDRKEIPLTKFVQFGRVFLKDDREYLYCLNCKKRVGELDTSCSYCGKSLMESSPNSDSSSSSSNLTLTSSRYQSNTEPSYHKTSYEEQYGGSYGRAVASMILGICGLAFTFFIPGPGLVCAIVGVCLGNP